MPAQKRVVYLLGGKDGTQISLDIRRELLEFECHVCGPRAILITVGSFCYFMARDLLFKKAKRSQRFFYQQCSCLRLQARLDTNWIMFIRFKWIQVRVGEVKRNLTLQWLHLSSFRALREWKFEASDKISSAEEKLWIFYSKLRRDGNFIPRCNESQNLRLSRTGIMWKWEGVK